MKMNISTKATNLEITPAIAEYIEKKVNMLEKYFSGTSEVLVNVEVGKTTRHHKSGDIFRAELQIVVNGDDYYVYTETDDLYAAIDIVKDDMARELSSRRKKTLRLLRKGAAQVKLLLKGFRDVPVRGGRRLRGKK